MHECFACHREAENVVWVPKFPKGAFPFCTLNACLRAAHRRAAVAFSENPRKKAVCRAPVS